MKKALLITIILTLLAICICIPVSASGTATVTFDADNDTPARGATVVVTVALNGSDMAKSMMIQPVYDSSVLELQSGEWILTGGMLTDNWSAEFGDAAIAYSSATDVNGDIFKMTFKVLDDAALGNTTINCNVTIMNGQVSIPNTTTPLTIKVSCASHSYIEKVDDAYFKSGADCMHKAVYYKSCSVCGKKGTETFETGNVPGHSWSSTYSQNAQGHYRTCTRTECGVSEDPTACDGGTKTCTTQATCSTCLKPYGTTLPHNYTNGTWKSDASGHWKKCKDCTAEDTESKVGHNATDDKNCATAVYCTDCNYMTVAAKSHNLTVGTSKNATHHIMECTNSGCDHTEDAAHSFNQKVESADYLKNNADCTTAKTYYYSCACGHKGSTTFTVGTELGHDFSVDKHDADNHWEKCSRCDEIDGKEAHNGGTATCTTQKVCTDCNTAYGDTLGHDFSVEKHDADYHCQKCSRCDEIDGKEAHNGGTATCTAQKVCIDCGTSYGDLLAHDYANGEWKSDASGHWKKCANCTAEDTANKVGHNATDDNNCATAVYCTDCNYMTVATKTHNLTIGASKDANDHIMECTNSGCDHTEDAAHSFNQKVESADYLKNNADCTTAKTYYYSCECGHKGSTTFTVGTELGHDFENGTWVNTDTNDHWKKCSRCNAEDTAHKTAHGYSNYTSNSNDTHSATCTCGNVDTKACSGGTATCTNSAVCSVCNTAYGSIDANNHNYSATLTQGATTHYYECSRCHGKKNEAPHEYNNYSSNGNDTHSATCTCGKVDTKACSGGTATCTDKAVCSVCNTVYGIVDVNNHSYASTLTQGATTHYYECSRCYGKKSEEYHENKNYTSNNNNTHTGTCVCGKTDTKACSGGTANCTDKAVCSVCNTAYGSIDTSNHNYASTLTQGTTTHYYECSRCHDKKNEAEHEYKNYTSNGNDTHTGTCVCGKTDTKACSGNDASATCQTKALCTVCGSRYGSFGAHDYDLTTWGYKGSDGHAHMCKTSGCTAHDTAVQHTSSSAPTEDDPETCTVCGFVINPATGHIHHTPVSEWSSNATQHWKECVGCSDQEFEKGEHVYDNACDTTCNTCEYVRQITHNYTYKHNDTQHWQECSVCGDEKPNSRDNHSGGNATCTDKAICTYCSVAYGEKNSDNHTKSTYHYTTNSNGTHKKLYDCCNATANASEACSGGSATCQNKAVCQHCNTAYGDVGAHNYDLTTWGYKAADGHAHVCKTSGCDAHDTVVAHTSSGAPTEANAEICTVCQYVINPALAHTTHIPKAEWSSDATHHWHECTGCSGQQLGKAEHIYDNACDTTCNACGYERTATHNYTELKHSDTEHWYECTCGAEKADSRVAHSGGEATCTAKAKCSVCDTEYGAVATHSYATEWSKNDIQHWHECACGEKSDKAEHAYGDDNVCDTCGYENESQSGTEPPPTDTTPAPTDPGNDDDGISGATIAIITISCVVALGGGFALYWFVFKKKKA